MCLELLLTGMYTLSKAVIIIFLLSVCTYAVQSASILENSSDLWRGWLLMEDEVPSQQNSPLTRRITPKSVFIAPSNIHCTDGYRHDGKDCVRIVKVDEIAQLDFLLQKINAIYPGSSSENNESQTVEQQESNKEDTSGPFQLSIPFGNNDRPMITNVDDILTLNNDFSKVNDTLHVISQIPTTTEVAYEYSTDESFLFPQIQEISNIDISPSPNITKTENVSEIFDNVYPTTTENIESTTKVIENHTNSYYDDSTTVQSITESNYNCFGDSCDINTTYYNTEQTINSQLNTSTTTSIPPPASTKKLLSDKPLISIFANGINYTMDTIPLISTEYNALSTEAYYEKNTNNNVVKTNFMQVATSSLESIINSTQRVISSLENITNSKENITSSLLENVTEILKNETEKYQTEIPIKNGTENHQTEMPIKNETEKYQTEIPVKNETEMPIKNGTENFQTELPIKNGTEKYQTEMPIKLIFSSPYKNNEFTSKTSEIIKFPIDKEKEIEKEWILNDEESLTKNEKRVVNNYNNDNINNSNKEDNDSYNNSNNNNNNNNKDNNNNNNNTKDNNNNNISFYEKLPIFEKKNKCTSNYEYSSECNNSNSNLVIDTSNIFNHSFQSKPNSYIRFPEIPSKSSTSYIRFPTHRLPTASSYVRESYVSDDTNYNSNININNNNNNNNNNNANNHNNNNNNHNINKNNNNQYWTPDRGQLWAAWSPPRPQMVRIWPENNYPVTNYNRHQSSSQSQLQWFNNKFFRSK